jgi:two-component system sensor histidine kinase BaeS
VFQILRSLEHDNDDDRPGPGMPPHGWRTQFWEMRVSGPRVPRRIPPDGTKRAISNGATGLSPRRSSG